jgi:ubiquinone/menaquinone biosynthesis C-methylase UbiE
MNAPSRSGEAAAVLDLYTELARRPDKDFGWGKGKENARALGYDARWLDILPDALWASAAAVGNPLSAGPLVQGDVVLDIGCGAGADACIAALTVGPEGRVVGVDLTPAMIEKARYVAGALGLDNVSFHMGEMASLPLAGASFDVVISNGAINLTAHKPCVFQEVYRVLKPGGRLQFADMVRTSAADAEASASWADCVAGAVEPEGYLDMMRTAGFVAGELVAYTAYKTSPATTGAVFRALKRP